MAYFRHLECCHLIVGEKKMLSGGGGICLGEKQGSKAESEEGWDNADLRAGWPVGCG